MARFFGRTGCRRAGRRLLLLLLGGQFFVAAIPFLVFLGEYARSWEAVRGKSIRLPSAANTKYPAIEVSDANFSIIRFRKATIICWTNCGVQRTSIFKNA